MHTPVSACDPRPALSHPGASSRPRYPQNRSKEAQDRRLPREHILSIEYREHILSVRSSGRLPRLRRARLALGGDPALFRLVLTPLTAFRKSDEEVRKQAILPAGGPRPPMRRAPCPGQRRGLKKIPAHSRLHFRLCP
jgi:hypothetical protein